MSNRYLRTKTTNAGRDPTFGPHCPRFYPNRLAFGGVIAERVKTVFAP